MTIDKAVHPNEVFHYTSVNGFKGIVETGTLFASDITFLNDRQELRFVDHFIRKSMTKKFVDVFNDVKAKKIFTKEFNIEEVAEKETNTLLRLIHQTSIKLNPIFVCSFCRAANEFVSNNGLLSQWRGYGRDGGVALCFSREGVETIVTQEVDRFEIVKGFSEMQSTEQMTLNFPKLRMIWKNSAKPSRIWSKASSEKLEIDMYMKEKRYLSMSCGPLISM